ncbi:MAG: hypothetical protein IK077_08165 [Thermoguttaceae bacterium]|nr:hypothetical protein [Thermoguttaceae bacterium]
MTSEPNAPEESKSSKAIVVLFVVVLILVLFVGYALMFKRGERTSFDLNSGREKTTQFVWFYDYKTTEQESIFCKRVKERGLANDEPRWVDESGKIGAKKVEYQYNGANDVAQNAEVFLETFRLDEASEREFLALILGYLAEPDLYLLAHEALTGTMKQDAALRNRDLAEEESRRVIADLRKEIERLENGGLAELKEKAEEFWRRVEETNQHMLEHAHGHDHEHAHDDHDHDHAHDGHDHDHDADHAHDDHDHDHETDHDHAHGDHDHDADHDHDHADDVPESSL